MSGTPEKFAKIHTLWNGTLQLDLEDVTLKENSNSSPINTIDGGYRGESPGSPNAEIDFKSVVGIDNFEAWLDGTIGSRTAEVQCLIGSRQFANICSVITRTIQNSAGQATTVGYTLRTQPLNWQKATP